MYIIKPPIRVKIEIEVTTRTGKLTRDFADVVGTNIAIMLNNLPELLREQMGGIEEVKVIGMERL